MKKQILDKGEQLFLKKGMAGFSYADISKPLGIKNAAIHYHFPSKKDLVTAILERERKRFQNWMGLQNIHSEDVYHLLQRSIDEIYGEKLMGGDKVCVLGNTSVSYEMMPMEALQVAKALALDIVKWFATILEMGQRKGIVFFVGNSFEMAKMLTSSLAGAIQLTRITHENYFEEVKDQLINQLKKRNTMTERRRVVVTGLGALTPIGNNVPDFLRSLREGRSGGGEITYFDTSQFKTKIACELKKFDPKDHLDRKEIRTNDPYLQYALVSTEEALQDSGIDLSREDLTRIGVIWGTGNGGIQSFYEEVMEYAKAGDPPRFNPYFVPKIIVNMAAGVISIKYGLKGISFTPVSACATGNTAIIEAANYIRWGQSDVIVAGGSDAAINPAGIAGFNANKALSTQNDSPSTASKPFDRDRDGFVMGEGSGTLILEEYEHAMSRGAKIYAEYVGGSMTSDAYHLTATHPEGEGAQRAIHLGLKEANLTMDDIDYVNMHATSTPMGDMSELKAIQNVLTKKSPKISATKSMTGHLLGGAGAVEAIASILAMTEGFIPSTINTRNIDEEAPKALDIVTGQSQPHHLEHVMSNTFGFGGHNAIVIFKRLPEY